jgi:hypothetical protein
MYLPSRCLVIVIWVTIYTFHGFNLFILSNNTNTKNGYRLYYVPFKLKLPYSAPIRNFTTAIPENAKKGLTLAIAHLKTFMIFKRIVFFIIVLVLFGFALLTELYRNKWSLKLTLHNMDQFMITYRHKVKFQNRLQTLQFADGGSFIAHSSPSRRPYIGPRNSKSVSHESITF